MSRDNGVEPKKCSDIEQIRRRVLKKEGPTATKVCAEGYVMDENIDKDDTGENPIKPPTFNGDEDWVKEYKEQFGTEPSFF